MALNAFGPFIFDGLFFTVNPSFHCIMVKTFLTISGVGMTIKIND